MHSNVYVPICVYPAPNKYMYSLLLLLLMCSIAHKCGHFFSKDPNIYTYCIVRVYTHAGFCASTYFGARNVLAYIYVKMLNFVLLFLTYSAGKSTEENAARVHRLILCFLFSNLNLDLANARRRKLKKNKQNIQTHIKYR